MSYSLLSLLPVFLISFLVAAMNVASAVILLREKHLSAWLMLGGSVIGAVGLLCSLTMNFYGLRMLNLRMEWLVAISALSSMGALCFAIGLLLHAMRQRSKADRAAELEAIIASLQNR